MINKLLLTASVLFLSSFFWEAQAQNYKYDSRSQKIERTGWRIVGADETYDVAMQCARVTYDLPSGYCNTDSLKEFSKMKAVFSKNNRWICSKDKNCILMLSSPLIYTKSDSVRDTWGKKEYSYRLYDDFDDPAQYREVPGVDFSLFHTNLQHLKEIKASFVSDVTYYSHEEAIQMFHADTVISYLIPTRNIRYDKYSGSKDVIESISQSYPFCKVFLVQKRDRGYIRIACFFNEQGKDRVKQYPQSLTGLIRYQEALKESPEMELCLDQFSEVMKKIADRGIVLNLLPDFIRCFDDTIGTTNGKAVLKFTEFYDYYKHATIQSADHQTIAIIHAPIEYNKENLKKYGLKRGDFQSMPDQKAKEWFNADFSMIQQNDTNDFRRMYLSVEDTGHSEVRYHLLRKYFPEMATVVIVKDKLFIKVDLFSSGENYDSGIMNRILSGYPNKLK